MRIVIHDELNEVVVVMHAPGGYAPDVMHDLKARAGEAYRDTLITRAAVADHFAPATEDVVEGE